MFKERLLTEVCSKCPGTLWGEKSICRAYQKPIGEIEKCREWEHHDFTDEEGQYSLFDLEPAMEVVQKTEEDLKSYHWMVKEIDRLTDYINNAIKSDAGGSNLIAQYGIEAIMPKAQGKPVGELSVSDAKFERQIKRLEKLKNKVSKINSAAEKVTDEKERTVLECILDGERMNMIARHVGISRQRLNEIKRLLVNKMAWELYPDELENKKCG